MAVKIEKTIVDYSVLESEPSANKADTVKRQTPAEPDLFQNEHTGDNIIQLHERMQRPDVLRGSTYKIKPPNSDHAFYVTINDFVLNPKTPYEKWRPFEIFINSKNMENFQWTVALTRVISAVFRKGGDITFLVEELTAVFDPHGGYWQKGRMIPSLVAEIGMVIETHMKKIGVIKEEEMSDATRQALDEKRREYEKRYAVSNTEDDPFPYATLCMACRTKAVILMDGCKTCLNCGDSKCS